MPRCLDVLLNCFSSHVCYSQRLLPPQFGQSLLTKTTDQRVQTGSLWKTVHPIPVRVLLCTSQMDELLWPEPRHFHQSNKSIPRPKQHDCQSFTYLPEVKHKILPNFYAFKPALNNKATSTAKSFQWTEIMINWRVMLQRFAQSHRMNYLCSNKTQLWWSMVKTSAAAQLLNQQRALQRSQ